MRSEEAGAPRHEDPCSKAVSAHGRTLIAWKLWSARLLGKRAITVHVARGSGFPCRIRNIAVAGYVVFMPRKVDESLSGTYYSLRQQESFSKPHKNLGDLVRLVSK